MLPTVLSAPSAPSGTRIKSPAMSAAKRPGVRSLALAAITALAIAAIPASPALAWGEKEQNFLAGLATALVVGTIANDIRHKNRDRRAQQYSQQPQYFQPQQPRPVYAPAPSQHSIYRTTIARAFGSYAPGERKAIQRQLAVQGYYRGGIDGAFGPGTYNAVVAYARDTRQADNLDNTAGMYGVYDGLLY